MVNQSKKNDPRFWKKWKESGAIGNIHGRDIGEAYAFFDCNAPRSTIESYLAGRLPEKEGQCKHDFPKPHKLGLELKLEEIKELMGNKDIDPDLLETIKKESIYSTYPQAYRELMKSAKPIPLKDLKYVITARNNQTNSDVCKKLTTVMNDVYLRFGEKKPFTVGIFGKDDGHYYPWESD